MDKQVFCYPVFPHIGNIGIEPTDYFFLGLLREPVADGQKRITAHRVGPRLGAPLRIYCVAEVAHLSEKVVATKFYHPLAFMNRFREGCIPIETVIAFCSSLYGDGVSCHFLYEADRLCVSV